MDNKKITLEDLIARKQQSNNDKLAYKDIYVKQLEGTITLKKAPLTKITSMMDRYRVDDAAGTTHSLEFEKELIYTCCPILQDKKLHETYADEITEPFDIVTAVFDERMDVMNFVADKILEFYGLNDKKPEELEKEVKN